MVSTTLQKSTTLSTWLPLVLPQVPMTDADRTICAGYSVRRLVNQGLVEPHEFAEFGTGVDIAQALGVSNATVTRWKHDPQRQPPALRAALFALRRYAFGFPSEWQVLTPSQVEQALQTSAIGLRHHIGHQPPKRLNSFWIDPDKKGIAMWMPYQDPPRHQARGIQLTVGGWEPVPPCIIMHLLEHGLPPALATYSPPSRQDCGARPKPGPQVSDAHDATEETERHIEHHAEQAEACRAITPLAEPKVALPPESNNQGITFHADGSYTFNGGDEDEEFLAMVGGTPKPLVYEDDPHQAGANHDSLPIDDRDPSSEDTANH
jgi:hypothetical protein